MTNPAAGIAAAIPAEPVTPDAPSVAPAEEAVTPTGQDFSVVDRDTFIDMFHGGGRPFTADGRLAAGKGVDAARAALSYVGTPFAWGGKGYEGLDSASLVRMTYRAIGADLPRLTVEQAQAGERVGLHELQPGDLVVWDAHRRGGTGSPHAAVHVGNGYIVEAPGPGLNVRRRRLDEDDLDAYGVRPMDPRRARPRAPIERER